MYHAKNCKFFDNMLKTKSKFNGKDIAELAKSGINISEIRNYERNLRNSRPTPMGGSNENQPDKARK